MQLRQRESRTEELITKYRLRVAPKKTQTLTAKDLMRLQKARKEDSVSRMIKVKEERFVASCKAKCCNNEIVINAVTFTNC